MMYIVIGSCFLALLANALEAGIKSKYNSKIAPLVAIGTFLYSAALCYGMGYFVVWITGFLP